MFPHKNNIEEDEIMCKELFDNVHDIVSIKQYESKMINDLKLLKAILNCTPDIIKIYNSDYTVKFYNDVGYKFYNKTYEEIKDKKCYSILGRKEKCSDCQFEKAMKTKKLVQAEKYVPEFNKYVHLSFNPILNDNNEVVFMIEKISGITENNISFNIIEENKEQVAQILDSSNYANVVMVDDKIILANNKLFELLHLDYKEIIGKSIYEFLPKNYIKSAHKRMKHILLHKKIGSSYDYKIICYENKIIDVEVSSSYFMYKNHPAIRAVIRDITEMKRGLNRAANIQKSTLQKYFLVPEKVHMESVYFPAKTVSGDFFRIYKLNDDSVIGIIVDVSGKGITAALSVSAFDVLFHEAVLSTQKPNEIINILNKKVAKYLNERYVAACCFMMDFIKNKIDVVGSGINEFIIQQKGGNVKKVVVKGPFLGMFEDSVFEEKIIHFHSGDKLYFFTDGLDFILDEDKIVQNYMGKVSITEFKNYIEDYLNDESTDIDGLKDDCTLLALEIR